MRIALSCSVVSAPGGRTTGARKAVQGAARVQTPAGSFTEGPRPTGWGFGGAGGLYALQAERVGRCGKGARQMHCTACAASGCAARHVLPSGYAARQIRYPACAAQRMRRPADSLPGRYAARQIYCHTARGAQKTPGAWPPPCAWGSGVLPDQAGLRERRRPSRPMTEARETRPAVPRVGTGVGLVTGGTAVSSARMVICAAGPSAV